MDMATVMTIDTADMGMGMGMATGMDMDLAATGIIDKRPSLYRFPV